MLKITLKNLILFLMLPAILVSCSEEGFDCSVCGDPDKAFYVTVVDTLGIPVNNLNIIIKDGCGNILNVPQNPFSSAFGQYTIVDDELLDLQSILLNCNKEISFSASNGTKTIETIFKFSVGDGATCYCDYPVINIYNYQNPPIIIFK